MKLLVILLCLLSERYLIHTFSLQRFSWFNHYCLQVKKRAEKHAVLNQPWALLGLISLPLIVVAGLIYWVFGHMMYGVIGFVISLLLFFYCLGPQNVFYPLTQSDTQSDEELASSYFAKANRQLFSLVFWYLLAGPIVALAYRVITLCLDSERVQEPAGLLTQWLEWIPARLTALLYLLVGNFQQGLKPWLSYLLAKPELNNKMLEECALHAVRTQENDPVTMPVAENLVEHAVIVMLVLIALFTLISWL